ncbi:hypothetical protein FLAG1_00795 [Fusarium langsethiae]|uniref:Uncharacterized protein n=1 Tax=Fusarium langsethiae TaxID=179993 RepID=A0A0M9F4X2_FUSLA|nr:hypothetical protein FLAG1_00795 [Fusarium langsethiae]GKT98022.1 unnamed protein product [Fusarium langsethiae]GKU11128.1 unnamed protein product [Fusarium langsethiae]
MAEQVDVGAQAKAAMEEIKNLREICASQNKKIEQLSGQNKRLTESNEMYVKNQAGLLKEGEDAEDEIESLKTRIADLNAQIAEFEVNTAFYTELLDDFVAKNKELQAKRAINHGQIHALDARLQQCDACVTKLINVLHRKIVTGRIALAALNAAHRALPSPELKTELEKIYKTAEENVDRHSRSPEGVYRQSHGSGHRHQLPGPTD